MQELLRVVKPRNDENIYSYINRLTEENMYESNTWILKQAGIFPYIGPRNVLPWNFDFIPFIKLTGLSLEELLKLTLNKEFGYEEGEFELFNYLLYKESLMGQECKICPYCIDEFGQNNKLWDIRFLLVCPIHKCLLITKCSRCGKLIHQYRKSFYLCSCNADLRSSKTKPISDSSSLILPNIVFYKLYNEKKFEVEVSKNKLLQLKLKHIILIYVFFTKLFYRDKTKTGSMAIPYDAENDEFFKLIQNISLLFENWPNNYFKFLSDYQIKVKSKPKYDRGSLVYHFGYFYIDLYKKYNHPSLNILREEFERFIHESWEKTQLSHGKYFKKNLKNMKYLSTAQVAKMLNIQHAHVRKLISKGYLKSNVTSERNRYLLILRESVDEYIANKDLYMNREEIKEYLNIGYQTIAELEKRKILKIKRGPHIDGHLECLYDRRKVYQLLSIVHKRYYRYKNSSSTDSTTSSKLADIVRSTKSVVGTKLADILTLIIQGKLIPVDLNPSEKGLKMFLVQTETVKKRVFEFKIRTKQGVFSIPEIILFLGLGKNFINQIIENGLLKKTTQMEKPYIKVEDVIDFKCKYLTLGQLSNICSREYNALLEDLKEKKITPVLDSYIKKNKLFNINDIIYLI